jgi:hypothetical protein
MCVGEVKKLGHLCTIDGNIKWCSYYGKQYGRDSKELKI